MSTPPTQFIPVVVQLPSTLPEYKAYLSSLTAGTTVLSAQVGAADGLFQVAAYLSSLTFTSGSLAYTFTYTNEFSEVQTVPLYTATAPGIGLGLPFMIRAKAGTVMTVSTSGTFTATYNAGADIRQVA